MILIGRYLSPFVRRVAATLHLYGMPFEHRALATMGEDRDAIRELNPVTRVPALILDHGETLIDSGAILDWLDEQAGPERALTPPAGPERRRVLKLTAVATGAAEKGVLTVYEERFRPAEKRHAPWVEMISEQVRGGLGWLDAEAGEPFLTGERMSQADVTTVCAWEFLRAANPALFASLRCPRLEALSARLSEHDAFARTRPPQ